MPKALVVDDEADAREFVKMMLEAEGWDVDEAPDGAAGLEAMKAAAPDLAVLDVQMPKMNGFDLFRAMAAEDSLNDVKVIMLTGVAEQTGINFSAKDMKEFIGREPDAYIEKPVSPDVFVRTLSRVTGS